MPTDTPQILEAAEKLGQMLAQHPAAERYRQAQKTLAEDPDATRLMNDFNRQIMTLARQEESGMPVTDAQRHQLENLQAQLASHLKVKNLNIAQVEFVDLMRKISDSIRRYVAEGQGAPAGPGGGGAASAQAGPRIVM